MVSNIVKKKTRFFVLFSFVGLYIIYRSLFFNAACNTCEKFTPRSNATAFIYAGCVIDRLTGW
jgi:hypothetical protein